MRALILLSAILSCALFVACGGGSKLDESLTSLKVGDCVGAGGEGNVTGIETVDCGTAGSLIVIKVFDMPDAAAFPGDSAVSSAASASGGCPPTTVQYLGPTQDSWDKAHDRQVICFATFDLVGTPTP